jgi:hypothetical protein
LFLLSFGKIKAKNPWKDGDLKTSCIEEVAAILRDGLGVFVPLELDDISVRPFREWVRNVLSKRDHLT